MKQEKTFKTGILVGRFQHIHTGHERLINIGLNLCDKVLVFVGSANAQISNRNPYEYITRKEIIELIYSEEIANNKIIIKPLNDFENNTELSSKWGNYVLDSANQILGNRAECIIYGKDKNIFKCFDKKTVQNITEILVDRKNFEISATTMRKWLLEDNESQWRKYANEKIHNQYPKLRSMLLNAKLDKGSEYE